MTPPRRRLIGCAALPAGREQSMASCARVTGRGWCAPPRQRWRFPHAARPPPPSSSSSRAHHHRLRCHTAGRPQSHSGWSAAPSSSPLAAVVGRAQSSKSHPSSPRAHHHRRLNRRASAPQLHAGGAPGVLVSPACASGTGLGSCQGSIAPAGARACAPPKAARNPVRALSTGAAREAGGVIDVDDASKARISVSSKMFSSPSPVRRRANKQALSCRGMYDASSRL